jgi:hypothetical protein
VDTEKMKTDLPLSYLINIWKRRETQAVMKSEEWADIILILQKLLPDYAVRDFTNLENDHCYIVEVLLHEGQTSFLDDGTELLTAVCGKARVLQIFVSQIAPYYYHYVWEMSKDGTAEELTFTYPRRAQLSSKNKQIAFLIERVFNSYGYQLLHPRTAAKVVEGIETECLNKGEVTVFHLLFSELFSVH